jgi:hypothetical protein
MLHSLFAPVKKLDAEVVSLSETIYWYRDRLLGSGGDQGGVFWAAGETRTSKGRAFLHASGIVPCASTKVPAMVHFTVSLGGL